MKCPICSRGGQRKNKRCTFCGFLVEEMKFQVFCKRPDVYFPATSLEESITEVLVELNKTSWGDVEMILIAFVQRPLNIFEQIFRVATLRDVLAEWRLKYQNGQWVFDLRSRKEERS